MKNTLIALCGLTILLLVTAPASAQFKPIQKPTYAERLGWPAGSKVVIFHIDDAGMSHDSNLGVIEALENGITTSTSIMFPCGWVPEMMAYAKAHPDADIGVHGTLTAEWSRYRWMPVAGKAAVPGLTDPEGCLWPGVLEVVMHASPDEFETELRAQVDKAIAMGLKPTHIDTHMGTVFYPGYVERYFKVGMDTGIPVMMFGGHMQHISQSALFLRWYLRKAAERLWNAGLPVLDDLVLDPSGEGTYEERRARVIGYMRDMKPGITQMIVHCTQPTAEFSKISGSGAKRLDELKIVTDPEVKKFVQDNGIILTTWRELKERRDKIQ